MAHRPTKNDLSRGWFESEKLPSSGKKMFRFNKLVLNQNVRNFSSNSNKKVFQWLRGNSNTRSNSFKYLLFGGSAAIIANLLYKKNTVVFALNTKKMKVRHWLDL